ncbi:MAG: DUF4445 domain-containing protein [Armatimonadetes bacterium]|nr:DUF4445 domain-containing protein [Armatimonadota bacterium]
MKIRVLPLGAEVEAAPGQALQDVLFPLGVEFPCGGRGRCKGCRVRVLEGSLAPHAMDREVFTEAELAEGWRLSCRARVEGDLVLQVRQWDTLILDDNSPVAFDPQEGFGIAVDLGTTTVVAQLLDLSNGQVRAVRTGLNAQAKRGADVMSRLEYAMNCGAAELQQTVNAQLARMTTELVTNAGIAWEQLRQVTIVGNTVMQHLMYGFPLPQLALAPHEPHTLEEQRSPAPALGWPVPEHVIVRFLPNLGGFVGSDILGVILATRMLESDELVAAADLGTNGEIAAGDKNGILVSSTAAGPAFEGGKIELGMRAGKGAISRVSVVDHHLDVQVIGGGAPRGLCGSGLLDAVAAGLDLGLIQPTGRITDSDRMMIQEPVYITQRDVRELQLAKAAIAAGLRLILEEMGKEIQEVKRFYLAGAFGNTLGVESAEKIGLFRFGKERTVPVGNSALRGAKIALLSRDGQISENVRQRVRFQNLSARPRFQELFGEEMYLSPEPLY